MISIQLSGLLLAIFLLVGILAFSCLVQTRQKKACNEEIHSVFFEKNDFPSVIIDRELKICLVNENFRNFFSSFTTLTSLNEILDCSPFSETSGLKNLLQDYQTTGKLPNRPLFIGKEPNQENANSVAYVMVRNLSISRPEPRQYLIISLIHSDYINSILAELTRQIALSESNLKKLEELDRLKSEFLATLSHELKTPLVSIKGYLDLIATQKMGPLTEKQEKAIRVSLRNTSHLNNLISSILNFARMEAGKLKFDRVNQKMTPLINDIIDSLKPLAESQHITLVSETAAQMPSVCIDGDLMHRVLSNLIENSIKFSPPGSTVTVRARQLNEDQLRVEVADSGCGIPADKMELIKAPFFQADKSDTRPTGGLGLGLAIAEKILIGHGTTLDIESSEGKGTICSFVLRTIVATAP